MEGISPDFVSWYMNETVRYAARRLKINGWEWRTAKELARDVDLLASGVGDEIRAFGGKYGEWAAQTRKDATDTQAIIPLIQAREASRDRLMQVIDDAA